MFGGWDLESSLPRTWWWGERGLVSALFYDLSAGGSLDRWSAFLDLIRFSGAARSWGGLKHADVVVEPSFGSRGFGRPDGVAPTAGGCKAKCSRSSADRWTSRPERYASIPALPKTMKGGWCT